jgi:GTP-binding protein
MNSILTTTTAILIQDVPGLVAGAAKGVGLGHAFLRHVERCHVILHLVDATSIDAAADFAMLNRELAQYGTGQLANMPQVVVVNKVDAFEEGREDESEQGLEMKVSRQQLKKELEEVMQHSRLMWVSAKEKDGVDELMGRMAKFVHNVKDTKAQAAEE